MSMTGDEYQYDQWMSELYTEHSKEALQEFTSERLQSYYLIDPDVAKAPMQSLQEARGLLADHQSASVLMAVVAIEVGIKTALLKPIVFGLVHDASAAGLITDLVIGHQGDRYRDLLFHILASVGGVNLKTFRRAASGATLWDEIAQIQKVRNGIAHRANKATFEQSEQAIAVASAVLEQLFPEVVQKLGLHLHGGVRICNKWQCKHKDIQI